MSNFNFTEEQRLFRWAIKDFCKRKLTLQAQEIDTKQEIPQEVIKGMADLDLLALTASPEYGGAGATFTMATIATEELAYADISMATSVFFLVEAAWAFIFNKYGTKKALMEVMPKIVKGERFLGIASTEPDVGSDVAALKTTAQKEGDKYLLNGEKAYISGIKEVQRLGGGYVTIAKTSPKLGHKGETLFYVPMNTPGVTPTPLLQNMGRMGISSGGFIAENAKIPQHYVIGEVNRGFYYALEGFTHARVLVAAACIGTAKRALEIGIDYIKQRKAFGKSIGKFEGIQFQLADDYTKLECARLLVYKAAWMLDEFKKGKFTYNDLNKAVAMAKLQAGTTAFDIYKDVMLWHGAYGYTKDCPLEMGFRAVMSYIIGAEGAQNIMRMILGTAILGRDFSPTSSN
jgi:acyl-CoA dehydrogenase